MSKPPRFLLAFLLATACCPNPAAQRNPVESKLTAAPDVGHATEDEKTLYIVGIAMGRSATWLDVSEDEVRFIQAGLADQVAGRPAQVSVETYAPKVEELANRRAAGAIPKREAAGKAAREAAAGEPGANQTASGLVIRTLKPGSGTSPTSTDKVKVRYRGTFPDGKVFDSSMAGEPVELQLAGTIACWKEALPKMKIGETAKLVCPPELAYGEQGNPPNLPGHATLIFEIELVAAEPALEKKASPDRPAPADNIPLDLKAP